MSLESKRVLNRVDSSIWGEGHARDIEAYTAWLSKHPHCNSPRAVGPEGPKPGLIQDEENPALYYTSYIRDKPKAHNMYAKHIGKLGKMQEVSEAFEVHEWKRKTKNHPVGRWDDYTVDEYTKKYLIPFSNNLSSIDENNTITAVSTAPAKKRIPSLDELWPAHNVLTIKPQRNNKVSPWVAKYEGTQYTRNGTFLLEYQKLELHRNIEKCLQIYTANLSGASASRVEKIVTKEIMEINEEECYKISNEIENINNKIKKKSYWYDLLVSAEENVGTMTGFDLDEACFRGNATAVRLLLLSGKSPVGGEMEDPIFNRLFEKALSLDIQSEVAGLSRNNAESPLRKNIELILHNLLKYGANINFISEVTKYAPIHRAAISGNIKLFKLLLDRGANIHVKSKKDNFTAVQYAAKLGHVYIIADAVKTAGLDIALATDSRGWNSLHISCSQGQRSTALFLLGIGVDKRILDSQSLTAGQIAQNHGFSLTGIEVLGYCSIDNREKSLLEYLTNTQQKIIDEINLTRDDDSDEDGYTGGDSRSVSSFLLGMTAGATSNMKRMMSYLYKSLHFQSEKV